MSYSPSAPRSEGGCLVLWVSTVRKVEVQGRVLKVSFGETQTKVPESLNFNKVNCMSENV